MKFGNIVLTISCIMSPEIVGIILSITLLLNKSDLQVTNKGLANKKMSGVKMILMVSGDIGWIKPLVWGWHGSRLLQISLIKYPWIYPEEMIYYLMMAEMYIWCQLLTVTELTNDSRPLVVAISLSLCQPSSPHSKRKKSEIFETPRDDPDFA